MSRPSLPASPSDASLSPAGEVSPAISAGLMSSQSMISSGKRSLIERSVAEIDSIQFRASVFDDFQPVSKSTSDLAAWLVQRWTDQLFRQALTMAGLLCNDRAAISVPMPSWNPTPWRARGLAGWNSLAILHLLEEWRSLILEHRPSPYRPRLLIALTLARPNLGDGQWGIHHEICSRFEILRSTLRSVSLCDSATSSPSTPIKDSAGGDLSTI